MTYEDSEGIIKTLTAERDEAWRRAGHAEEQWGRCEVKLLKMVEALRKLATSECFGKGDVLGMSIKESPMGRELMARMEYARTVLSLNDFIAPKREIVDDEGRFILGYVAKQKGEDKE
jgi:hypothetical protein